jgi:hypothetical protein
LDRLELGQAAGTALMPRIRAATWEAVEKAQRTSWRFRLFPGSLASLCIAARWLLRSAVTGLLIRKRLDGKLPRRRKAEEDAAWWTIDAELFTIDDTFVVFLKDNEPPVSIVGRLYNLNWIAKHPWIKRLSNSQLEKLYLRESDRVALQNSGFNSALRARIFEPDRNFKAYMPFDLRDLFRSLTNSVYRWHERCC